MEGQDTAIISSLSGVYELTLDVTFDDAGMFFGGVFTVDCSVERLFGGFCSGRLPEFQLHCSLDDFHCIHWLFSDTEDFHCRFQQ